MHRDVFLNRAAGVLVFGETFFGANSEKAWSEFERKTKADERFKSVNDLTLTQLLNCLK